MASTTHSEVKKRTKCEVWTRVMGYHRPVQNFNPGKKSEHYSRIHFKEGKSINSEFENKYIEKSKKYLLFTTATCPKCPEMKEEVSKKISFDGELIDSGCDDFRARAERLNVISAPTLIVFDENDAEIARATDLSELDALIAKVS